MHITNTAQSELFQSIFRTSTFSKASATYGKHLNTYIYLTNTLNLKKQRHNLRVLFWLCLEMKNDFTILMEGHWRLQ